MSMLRKGKVRKYGKEGGGEGYILRESSHDQTYMLSNGMDTEQQRKPILLDPGCYFYAKLLLLPRALHLILFTVPIMGGQGVVQKNDAER